MSDIKLFRTSDGTVEELKGTSVQLEKSLQTLIEQNLEAFLGICFLASEHNTGKVHGGRIDTLGIDENGCPVIIEYKKALNENVINQGLFYLDWLMDHKADFRWLVMDRTGKERADSIDWNSPRLLCIAGDFTNYDEHAIKQIPRNIELIRYRRYGSDFLILELVSPKRAAVQVGRSLPTKDLPPSDIDSSYADTLRKVDQDVRNRFETLEAFLLSLGSDVYTETAKTYLRFKYRRKIFASMDIRPRTGSIIIWTNLKPESVALDTEFMSITYKTITLTITNDLHVDKAKPLLRMSYDAANGLAKSLPSL